MKRGWLAVGAFSALTLVTGTPAMAASENSLGKLLYLATGIVIPNNGNNWVNRDGASEWTGQTVTAVEVTAADGLFYQGGGLFQAGQGTSAKLGNISGNTDLALVNYKDGNTGTQGTIFAAGASLGSSNTFNPIGNPFAMAATKSGVFSSTKVSDSNPVGIGALIFRATQDSSGSDNNVDGGFSVAGTSVLDGDYLIGWEDSLVGDPNIGTDSRTGVKGDYQDYIVSMHFDAPIPEPAFYQMSALLVLGGAGVVRMRRRKSA